MWTAGHLRWRGGHGYLGVMPPNLGTATLDALGELSTTSITTIQYRTAVTWAGRAMASFQLFQETGDITRLLDGEDFMHEALEHAALSGDEALFITLRGPLVKASEKAREAAIAYMARGQARF